MFELESNVDFDDTKMVKVSVFGDFEGRYSSFGTNPTNRIQCQMPEHE